MGGDARALAGGRVTVAASRGINIRHAGRSDLPALVAIERASFSDPWSVESFASALTMDRMRVLVAEQTTNGVGGAERILVGYVLALVLGQDAEIADLAVAPSARRRGIGRRLLERILEDVETRGVDSVFLEVRESNVAARALYAAQGFAAVGRRPGYYRQPSEDALLLKREFAPT
jgi:[ribosomal protein S18]-alanine N-acetyltransferase